VIPRLARSSPGVRRTPEWPEWPPPHRQLSDALFEPRPRFRILSVLADADLLAEPDDRTLSPKLILAGLLAHRHVRLLRYGDDGPFPGVPHRQYGPPEAGLAVAAGWAELLPPAGKEGRGVLHTEAAGPVLSAVWGKRAEYARGDITPTAYRDLNRSAAADQRARDALAAEVAQAVGADIFITERPYLFETRAAIGQGVAICRTAEAVALVSLYLRSQGEFIVFTAPDGNGGLSMNEGLFYQVGSVELLSQSWRWSHVCAQISQATGDETMSELYGSLLRRLQRALKTRDGLHRTCNLLQNNDTARTVLTELDSILVSLMGTVDGTARVAHLVLGLSGTPRGAGWQHDQNWLPKVAAHEPDLAKLFDPGTAHHHTLTILRLLRNTVHGQMLRTTAIQRTGRLRETAIRLPPADEAMILAAMSDLGGREAWGVQTGANGSALVDPADFVERLFPDVLNLLNTTMERTPVERLASAPSGRTAPAVRESAHWYSEQNRCCIRWQLGF
jgi:hypothetical protein